MPTAQDYINPQPIKPLNVGNLNTSNMSAQGIIDLFRQAPRQSFTETVFPRVLPLLRPSEGLPGETQEAITNIQNLGQENIRQSIGNVGTAAQKRGLTGSSIEMGAIGEASRAGQADIMRQINPLIANAAQQKIDQRNKFADFLTQAYGVDFQGNEDLLDMIGQIMGDELGRQTDLGIAEKTASATESAGTMAGIGNIIGGLGGALLSDKRLKYDINKVGKLDNGLNVYSFKFKGSKITQIGLIAQEVMEVNPDAVKVYDGYLAVDYKKAVE